MPKCPEGKTMEKINGRREIARQKNGGAKERNLRRIQEEGGSCE